MLVHLRAMRAIVAQLPLWLYLPVAVTVAVERRRDIRVCPDPAHLFVDVLAKVGYVEDTTPIVQSRIS